MNRMRIYILLSSIVWMSAVVTAQDVGLTKIANWLKFPPDEHPGWSWETIAGVDFDSQGNLYISSRGGTAPPLTVWKHDGTLLRVFPGPKVLTWDHYVEIDRENNDIVWWAVEGDNVVYKMNQDGNVLLTLGTLGVDGSDATHFRGVTDVAWGPTGDLYVTDGARKITCRVVKYDKDGNFIKDWGSMGTGDGQFYYPHSVYVTSDERVLVCDRNNGRIHVYDKDGNLLEYWND
ncbi:MAG: NHL repeat-containing protein, partial [Planctomycetota bacterium]